MTMSRMRRGLATLAVAGVLVLAPASVAYALTTSIGATNPCANCLVQHTGSSWRYHGTDPTTVKAKATLIPGCGGELRLGLRNVAGTQFVPSVAWTIYSTKYFNGGATIAPIWFKMNSNVVGDCDVAGTTWKADLTY